jgi:hypothetical protein
LRLNSRTRFRFFYLPDSTSIFSTSQVEKSCTHASRFDAAVAALAFVLDAGCLCAGLCATEVISLKVCDIDSKHDVPPAARQET